MSLKCPLCRSDKSIQLDEVDSVELSTGYAEGYVRTDVKALLPAGAIALRQCTGCDLKWFEPLAPGDGKFYESLQQHDWYYQRDKAEFVHAAGRVDEFGTGLRVLEVGCGCGAFATHLTSGHRYRGLEFNDKAIALASEAGLDVAKMTVQDEAMRAPGTYDIVCHFQVLEHVADVDGFMSACVQALRPGGMLLVTVPADDSFVGIAAANWLNLPPHHLTRWTDAALRNMCTRFGLDVHSLWHDEVADYHTQWYTRTMQQHAVSALLGVQAKLTEPKWMAKLSNLAARLPTVRSALAGMGERRFPFAGRGHSVMVAGVKRRA